MCKQGALCTFMRHLMIVLSALILFSCNKDKNYRIKVHVHNRETGIVRLSHDGGSSMDSKENQIVNGEFVFEGNLQFPEQFFLIYKGSGPKDSAELYYSFFIEPSAKVDLVIYPDSISKSIIKGSKIGKIFHENSQIMDNQYNSKMIKLRSDFENAMKKNDIDQQARIIKLGDSLNTSCQNWKLSFIKSNSNSFISAYYLYSMLNTNVDTLKKYFSILDKSLSESKYSKAISSFLSVLPGNKFQDFELYDNNRKLYKFSNIAKDKIIIIDFWASWCKPCREQNVKLAKLYSKYKSTGLEIVGISMDRDSGDFVRTISEDKMTWINLIDKNDENAVHKLYRSYSVPYNVIIDRNGTIVYNGNEFEKFESIIKMINK